MEVEEPQPVRRVAEVGVGEIDEDFGRARRRRQDAILVCRQHAENEFRVRRDIQVEVDQAGGRVADQHLLAVEGKDAIAIGAATH